MIQRRGSAKLEDELEDAQQGAQARPAGHRCGAVVAATAAASTRTRREVSTPAVPDATLRSARSSSSSTVPDGLHAQSARSRGSLEQRAQMVAAARDRSTGAGETSRIGTLLDEGTPSASPGRTARRGTFSHRHAVLSRHARPASSYIAARAPARPSRRRSASTTARCPRPAVLGFEYGYSLDCPDALVMLGGAVRRLRERRPGDHRPVHRLRRGQVEAPRPASCCSCRTATKGQGPEHSSARSSAS